ncbi:MAG: hypothetical protein JW993_12805 [Sedimentisphaerales bacterium]|nr:hypothetical protein [Sedimentisphaerales bacterium]
MKRAWVGLALLSASWLFGLGYYHDPNWPVWAVLVLAGTGLLTGATVYTPTRIESVIAAAMLVPAVMVAPWPYRAGAILVLTGLLLAAAPVPRTWPRRLGVAAMTSGAILAAQALTLLAYQTLTARSHELPGFLAHLVYRVARLLGMDAALDGNTIALGSIRRVHQLGATWELLLDPTTVAFVAGGAAMFCLVTLAHESRSRRIARALASAFGLAILVALWLPVRAGLLLAIYMHRALRTAYDAPLVLMNQFWNPWVNLALLAGPVLLALRCFRAGSVPPRKQTQATSLSPLVRAISATLACAGSLLLATGLLWEPSGPSKEGRVWVDEHRSNWERTDRPYDPNWYGQESGYNYACIYDYCSRFYEMDRLTQPIDAETLTECDVLVVKVPTVRYDTQEIAHIERFVEHGGGLLLIGEHTNVFNSGTYLNDMAACFGFRFRYDCLFDIDDVFNQVYRPPLAAHPTVQHMPPLDFAVSCSIALGTSKGRAAIQATGLRSMPADYHVSNYYPQVEDRAESRYGAFIQLWTTSRGAGRVAAFTDSTIFSNFSVFEPGKAELMLGMLAWLNHRSPASDTRPFLMGLGAALILLALLLASKWTGGLLVLFSAATLGLSAATLTVHGLHRASMPAPKPKRPFTHVVIDRTVCDAPLSKSGFIAGRPDGFGIFERWILRLGYFTSRREADDAFTGDALIFLHPNHEVSADFRKRLADYVAAGGKVLVLDSPANAFSTANALLGAFGLSVSRETRLAGPLETPVGWPATVSADAACEIEGGRPLVHINGRPVAATARFGDGSVTVVGFGSRFVDTNMGGTGDVLPDPQLRQVYELQFQMLRTIILPSW